MFKQEEFVLKNIFTLYLSWTSCTSWNEGRNQGNPSS